MSTISSLDVPRLLAQERKLEDEAINTDILLTEKLETIYQEWAENLKAQQKAGLYTEPINTISSYIKARLRLRGVSEGSIDHVSYCLAPEFKQSKFNEWRNESDFDDLSITLPFQGSDGNPSLSVFLDPDKSAREIRALPDMYSIVQQSTTEATLVIKQKLSQLNELKKRIKTEVALMRDFAQVYRLRVFPVKISAELPPEEFRGITKLESLVRDAGIHFKVIGDKCEDIAQQIHDFKPDEETAKAATEYIEKFIEELTPYWQAINYTEKAIDQMLTFHSDKKYAANEPYWFNIGFDNIDNSGAHGSGIINAIRTGQVAMELGKDKKSIVEFHIEREFTKEDVTDQTAANLLLKARNAVLKEPLQKALNTWSEHIAAIEQVGDPQEYYVRCIQKEKSKGLISPEQAEKLLAMKDKIKIIVDPEDRKIKQVELDKKRNVKAIEHAPYLNISRRRQYKAEPFSRKS